MNILVWSCYVLNPVGGQERTSLELALQLHQRGHRVVLVGPFDNAPELRAQIPSGMPYYFFDMQRRVGKPHWQAARLLWRLTREHEIEIVSAHGNIFALFEVCRWRRIPMVWTIHGTSPVEPTGLMEAVKKAAIGRVLHHTLCHIVGVSRCTADVTARRFPKMSRSKVHAIITGGMDDRRLLDLPAPQPGPPWQLGFIGRVVPQKQPLHLVAVAEALRDTLDFRFHVFGDGSQLAELRAAVARAGLADRFMLHGYWAKGAAGMIEQLHLLVHPAAEEPLGLVMIEAQLGARPVVAYRVDGIAETVVHERTGYLAPPGDVDGLVNGIRQLTGPSFASFSANAREHAAIHFTLERMAAQYETLFQQICASL
jgi:glycosyltransferase involved in cell wall biosynthesis